MTAALVTLLGVGCASFDPAPAREPRVDPVTLGAKAVDVDWPAPDWWHRYQDPQLDRLITDALAGSPTLVAARARVAKADAAAGVARAATLPQVTGNLVGTYQRFSENYIYPPPYAGNWYSDSRLSFDFTWELDFWNKNGAALQAALSQAQASAAEAETTRVLLTTSVARAYFHLQRLFAQRAVSLAAITQREEVVRITSQRFTAGLDTRVEVRQAEAALATVRTELAQYEENIALVRHQIAALLGAGPERGDVLVARSLSGLPLVALPSTVPLDLVARRPEIVASRWRIEATGYDIDVAKALFYPNINLVAFAGFTAIGINKLIESASGVGGVGPAIHLPIFEGGRLRANLRGREADADLAIATYNQAVIDGARDVADALSSIKALAVTANEQRKARTATTAAYDLAVIRYKAGLGNYLSVLTSQSQELLQDRLDADLTARAFELDVNLVRALGGGYIDPVATLSRPHPAPSQPGTP